MATIIALAAMGGFVSIASAQQNSPPADIKEITVVHDTTTPPYYFYDGKTETTGLLIDAWKLWSEKTGIKVKFVYTPDWDQTLKMVSDGTVDAHIGLFHSAERSKTIEYVAELFNTTTHLFYDKRIFCINSPKDLEGFKVGVLKGDTSETYMRKNYPNVELTIFPDGPPILEGFQNGRVRAFVYDTYPMLYYIRQMGMTDQIRFVSSQPLYTSMYWAGATKKRPQLHPIIKAGFAKISKEEMSAIQTKWVGGEQYSGDVIRVACAYDNQPYQFLDPTAAPAGIDVDLWKLWSKKTNRKIEFVISSHKQTFENLANGRTDVMAGMTSDDDAAKGLLLSNKIYEDPLCLFSLPESPATNVNAATSGTIKIGIVESSPAQGFIKTHYPAAQIVAFDNDKAMTTALLEKKVPAIANTELRQMQVLIEMGKGLSLTSRTIHQAAIYTATTKDKRQLMTEINDGFSAITSPEKDEILRKWGRKTGVEMKTIIRWSVAISGGVAMILVIMSLWNRMLKQQVRKRTAELESVRKYLQNIMNSMPSILVGIDPAGKVTYWNQRAGSETGLNEQQVRGQNLSEIFPNFSQHLAKLKSAIGDRKPHIVEKIHVDSQKIVDLVMFPLVANGIDGAVIRIDDVTERVKMEETLAQNEKMTTVGKLAAGVAHDFNNQLSVIAGNAELLTEEFKDPATEKYVQNILAASRRSAALTRQLTAFSRKGSGNFEITNINQIVTETIEMLSHLVGSKTTISQELANDALLTMGDPSMLQNALLNLGINARDAMANGGTLSFRTKKIVIGEESKDMFLPVVDRKIEKYILITITDTGCGMSDEVKKHLFEPFFTTKEIGKGTGMGLATVYGTVQNHKGFITVDSQVGRGTSMNIYLPLLDAIAGDNKTVSPSSVASMQIMIVDDECMIRDFMAEMLNNAGHYVLQAQDGKQAADIYRKRSSQIDLVIIDMLMPQMDGKNCAITIKQINPNARIVLMSGYCSESDAAELHAAGITGFLRKPLDRNSFIELITKIAAEVKTSK